MLKLRLLNKSIAPVTHRKTAYRDSDTTYKNEYVINNMLLLFMRCFVCILILSFFCSSVFGSEVTVDAPSAVLIDARTGIVVYDKSMNQRCFPASVTKIMTALLLLEKSGENLTDRISFSNKAVFSVPVGSSHIAMNEGDSITVKDALYGLMLPSANDVANGIAEYVSGDMNSFAKAMTERAKALGANNTNFTNAHGFHENNHYSTAYDMALIMKEAIKFPEFLQAISTTYYEIPPTEKQPMPRQFYNSNKMIFPNSPFFNEYVVGGKTGFTNEAKHTLATYARKDGIDLIAVVMFDEKNAPYTDTTALLESGFKAFSQKDVLDINDISEKREVFYKIDEKNEKNKDEKDEEEILVGGITVIPQSNLSILLPNNLTKANIEKKIVLPDKIYAPVEEEQVLGYVELSYKSSILSRINLVATEAVAAPTESELKSMLKGSEPKNSIGKVMLTIIYVLFGVLALCVLVILSLRLYFTFKRKFKPNNRIYRRLR